MTRDIGGAVMRATTARLRSIGRRWTRRRRPAAPASRPHRSDRMAALLSRRRVAHQAGTPRPTRRFISAYLGWILFIATAVIAGAAMMSWSRTPMYRSEADVLVQPRVFSATAAPQLPDMGTEKAVASSGVVLETASQYLGMSTEALSKGLSVSVPLNTHILQIAYVSSSPAEAQRRSQALAAAYVSYLSAQQPVVAPNKQHPVIAGAAKTSVITSAALPTSPASPNHALDLTVAMIIGLGLGVGCCLLWDRLDDRLRGPAELESQAGAPVLALVPALRQSKRDLPGRLVMARGPDSRAAEAYRDLRTRVLRAAARRGAKTLLVTSPIGDGKTSVAANLAVALAQSGQRVILVCADLRWPLGHELFGVPNNAGLADVVEGRAKVTDVLHGTNVSGLQLVTAGSVEGDHGAVLHSAALRWMFGELRGTADFVVVDAPPVLAGADTGAFAELAEMILLVASARQTTRGEILAAAGQLEDVRSKLIGVVLDDVGRRIRLPKAPLSLVAPGPDDADVAPLPGIDKPTGWAVPSVGPKEATRG
jgi:succinoglycan biosynthesis transport protein ExoP